MLGVKWEQVSKRRRWKTKKSNTKSNAAPPESVTILDKFTQADIRTWKKVSKDLTDFYYKYYFALEAQRASQYEELCDALRTGSNETADVENWVRLVSYKYSLEPLSSKGSISWVGGRFNFGKRIDAARFPPFNALYLASDFETGLREKFALGAKGNVLGLTREELALLHSHSTSSISVSGVIHNVFNLTKLSSLKEFVKIIKDFEIPVDVQKLGANVGIDKLSVIRSAKTLRDNLMAENWREWPTLHDIPSNSQIFGKILVDAGFEGILYPSSKGAGTCLAIFPKNLRKSCSFVEVSDAAPKELKNKRLDSSTFSKLT